MQCRMFHAVVSRVSNFAINDKCFINRCSMFKMQRLLKLSPGFAAHGRCRCLSAIAGKKLRVFWGSQSGTGINLCTLSSAMIFLPRAAHGFAEEFADEARNRGIECEVHLRGSKENRLTSSGLGFEEVSSISGVWLERHLCCGVLWHGSTYAHIPLTHQGRAH